MRERIDVYGIDASDLKHVARVFERKFNIAFDTEHDSEMGGVYYEYEPNPDRGGDQFWSLFRTEDGDVDEGEEGIEEPPFKLRLQDAPDMDDVRRKMAEIHEFKVTLVDWVVIDRNTGNVIDEYKSEEPRTEDKIGE